MRKEDSRHPVRSRNVRVKKKTKHRVSTYPPSPTVCCTSAFSPEFAGPYSQLWRRSVCFLAERESTLRADYIKSVSSLSPFNRCSQLLRRTTKVILFSLALSKTTQVSEDHFVFDYCVVVSKNRTLVRFSANLVTEN